MKWEKPELKDIGSALQTSGANCGGGSGATGLCAPNGTLATSTCTIGGAASGCTAGGGP